VNCQVNQESICRKFRQVVKNCELSREKGFYNSDMKEAIGRFEVLQEQRYTKKDWTLLKIILLIGRKAI